MRKSHGITFLFTLIYFLSFPALASAKVAPPVPPFTEIFEEEVKDKNEDERDYQRIIDGLLLKTFEEPYNYENYGILAFVYDYIGDYENALEAFKLEVAYLPEDAEEKDIYYGNLARAFMLTDQWEQGREWLDKADAINPDNHFNRWNAFDYYVQHKKDFPAAAMELKKLDQILGEDRDPYHEAYMKVLDTLKDGEAVISLFKETVKAEPNNFKTHRMLGAAIRNLPSGDYQKQFSLAMEELNTAYELNPRYIPTIITIANAHMFLELLAKKEGGYKTAEEWFEKAYAIDPDNVKAALAHGILLSYMQSYDKAIEKLEFAHANDNEDDTIKSSLAASYNGKAYGFYQAGEHLEEGLILVEKALALQPQDGFILSTKAELLYKLGRFQEAYEYIKKGITLEPDHAEIQQDFKMIEAALGIKKQGKD